MKGCTNKYILQLSGYRCHGVSPRVRWKQSLSLHLRFYLWPYPLTVRDVIFSLEEELPDQQAKGPDVAQWHIGSVNRKGILIVNLWCVVSVHS